MLIVPDLLWMGGALIPGVAVEVREDRIVRVRPASADDLPDGTPHILMPGFTDLQVNGGGGVMLNSDPTPEGLAAIVAAHNALGTSEILATVITDHPDVLANAVAAVLQAWPMPGLLGLHIEGPHIARDKRGTHLAEHIRPLDDATVSHVQRLRAAGVPVMLTLAPELADPSRLRRIVGMGAVVSAGHSMATAEQWRTARRDGVATVTHLFNAMPQMVSRAPGLTGAAILSDAYCGIIADGVHVDWDMIRLTLAARPSRDRTFLVSDAMATVGGPDEFDLYGRTIRLQDGALVNADGALAGAHLDLRTAVANLVAHANVPLEHALAMATDIPRAAMGLPPVTLEPGLALDRIIALGHDLRLIDPAPRP